MSPPSAAQLFPPLDDVMFHLLRAPKSLLKISPSLRVLSLPFKLEWVGDSLHHLDGEKWAGKEPRILPSVSLALPLAFVPGWVFNPLILVGTTNPSSGTFRCKTGKGNKRSPIKVLDQHRKVPKGKQWPKEKGRLSLTAGEPGTVPPPHPLSWPRPVSETA